MIFSPIYYILFPILLTIILNLFIFIFKLNKNPIKINPYLPPGYIIGLIWIIIFGFLGYAYYLLINKNKTYNLGSMSIIILWIFCLLYPFLTNGFSNKYISTILNILTLFFSLIVGLIVFLESKYIFLYLLPLIFWATYVNIVTLLF